MGPRRWRLKGKWISPTATQESALIAGVDGLAIQALQDAELYLGQPSPGMTQRSLIDPAAPVPPVQGNAAPFPGETSGNGEGTFFNAAFGSAEVNLANSDKGKVDVHA